ncbi:MAG: MarR family transcriptional regulator [Myxococcales bacterium]|nr:MarR family transcriptional regulator [Myxococcales bacterium]
MAPRAPHSPGAALHDLMVLVSAGDHGPDGNPLALMHEAGLSLPEVVALSRLRHGDACSIGELAALLGLSMSATSALVQRLVTAELAHRREDPSDRRAKQVTLSARGLAVIGRIAAARAESMTRGLARLPRALRAELLDVVARSTAALRVDAVGA